MAQINNLESNSEGMNAKQYSGEPLIGDDLFAEFDEISEALGKGIFVDEARVDRVIRNTLVVLSQALLDSIHAYMGDKVDPDST